MCRRSLPQQRASSDDVVWACGHAHRIAKNDGFTLDWVVGARFVGDGQVYGRVADEVGLCSASNAAYSEWAWLSSAGIEGIRVTDDRSFSARIKHRHRVRSARGSAIKQEDETVVRMHVWHELDVAPNGRDVRS